MNQKLENAYLKLCNPDLLNAYIEDKSSNGRVKLGSDDCFTFVLNWYLECGFPFEKIGKDLCEQVIDKSLLKGWDAVREFCGDMDLMEFAEVKLKELGFNEVSEIETGIVGIGKFPDLEDWNVVTFALGLRGCLVMRSFYGIKIIKDFTNWKFFRCEWNDG